MGILAGDIGRTAWLRDLSAALAQAHTEVARFSGADAGWDDAIRAWADRIVDDYADTIGGATASDVLTWLVSPFASWANEEEEEAGRALSFWQALARHFADVVADGYVDQGDESLPLPENFDAFVALLQTYAGGAASTYEQVVAATDGAIVGGAAAQSAADAGAIVADAAQTIRDTSTWASRNKKKIGIGLGITTVVVLGAALFARARGRR